MANVVSAYWDFGNGRTSNELEPIEQFEPGIYTVSLNLTDSDGYSYNITKELYVNVGETDGSLGSSDYLDNPICLHYGWKDEHGYGWSYNDGHFPWPLTPASIVEYEEDGITYTLVWDITDGKEYHINTYNNHKEKTSYKDKGIHSIETEIITPEFTGEMKSYDVSHVETNLKFKPDLLEDSFDPDFKVDVSLITDSREEPVETQYDVNTRNEVMFYFQNKQTEPHSRQRQLKLNTSESNFQLMNYESYFKSNDRFKRSSGNDSMEFFAEATEWYTRGKGYTFDRAKGIYTSNPIEATHTGPDNIVDSAAEFYGAYLLNPERRYGMVLWSKDDKPYFGLAIALVPFGDLVNGWQLYYFNGDIDSTWMVGKVFDMRLFNAPVTEEHLTEYRDKFEQYLPRA